MNRTTSEVWLCCWKVMEVNILRSGKEPWEMCMKSGISSVYLCKESVLHYLPF
jgi:hypothetical protein